MMDIASVTIGFLILLGAMTLGLHIATVMFGVGFIGAALYLGWPGANAMVVVYLGSMDEAVLLQLPLFILLGEILVRCGATDRMYRSLTDWLNPLPGGLAAHQRGSLRALLRGLGFVGRDGGDDLHRGAARRSRRRATTRAWCWARSPPAARWET